MRYTFFNDCSDRCTTRTQRALSLRFGPQIQTLLSCEGRRSGSCRAGKSRGRGACSIAGAIHIAARTGAEVTDGPTLEGDVDSWLRSAVADATQGRGQLNVGGTIEACESEPRFVHG